MPSLFETLIDIGEAAANRIDQPHFASVFLTKIAGRCIADSLNTRALKLLSDAQDRANSIEVEFLRTLTLIRIVDTYLLLGMEGEALTVARRALNSARSVEEQLLKADYLGELARVFFRLRYHRDALNLIREMLDYAEKEKVEPFEFAYRKGAAVAYAHGGFHIEAQQAVGGFRSSHARFVASISLALSYARMGNEREFLETANWIRRSPDHCAVTLSVLGSAYIAVKRIKDASELIHDAYVKSNDIADAEKRCFALLEIVDLCAQIGEHNRSKEILSKTRDEISRLQSPAPTEMLLQKLAEALARQDFFDESLRIVHSLRQGEMRQQCLQSVAAARMEAGRVEDALRVLSLEEDSSAKSVLIAIIVSLYKETEPSIS